MMKLWTNRASPFARKVRVLALELGIADRITEVETAVSPVSANSELARQNPLMKIPALGLDDGTTLYDSRVICEYLDGLHSGPKRLPTLQRSRFTALRLQALADGILDAAVLSRYESAIRPVELQWGDWLEGQKRKASLALDALEVEVLTFGELFDITQIAAACVGGYLDFRFPNWNWRLGRPQLTKWYERVCERPSMAATAPP